MEHGSLCQPQTTTLLKVSAQLDMMHASLAACTAAWLDRQQQVVVFRCLLAARTLPCLYASE